MEFAIRRAKKDIKDRDGDILVAAGQRFLAGIEDDHYIVINTEDQELTEAEVKEAFDDNECFGWLETLTTQKGNVVKRYIDMETEETFYCVFK